MLLPDPVMLLPGPARLLQAPLQLPGLAMPLPGPAMLVPTGKLLQGWRTLQQVVLESQDAPGSLQQVPRSRTAAGETT